MSHQLIGTKAIQKCSVDEIAAAVLYEGYILYPYRASAVKNRHRFNFGTLSPQAWSEQQSGADTCMMRTECLVQGDQPLLDVRVRFLHPMSRQVGKLTSPVTELSQDTLPDYECVASLTVNNQVLQTWQEVIEREVGVERVSITADATPVTSTFRYPASRDVDPLVDRTGYQPVIDKAPAGKLYDDVPGKTDAPVTGLIIREQKAVSGTIEISIRKLQPDLHLVSIVIRNTTPLVDCHPLSREDVMLFSFASTHAILKVANGQFLSLLEPPDEYAAAAKECHNEGCWPVLAGDTGDQTIMLSSPIILYDYPQIAAESDGDFFDGCEIDEMLALRVMTLTDEEKQAMRGVDDRARAILERTETRPEDYSMKLHGTMKRPSIETAEGTKE